MKLLYTVSANWTRNPAGMGKILNTILIDGVSRNTDADLLVGYDTLIKALFYIGWSNAEIIDCVICDEGDSEYVPNATEVFSEGFAVVSNLYSKSTGEKVNGTRLLRFSGNYPPSKLILGGDQYSSKVFRGYDMDKVTVHTTCFKVSSKLLEQQVNSINMEEEENV